MKQSDKAIPEYDVFLIRIGKRIMDLRLRKHMTRKDLAKLADISEKYLYEIEIGKKACSGYILYRLAKSLKISLDDLTECSACREDFEGLWNQLHDDQREVLVSLMQSLYQNL